jgi:hypothetical protein
VDRGNVAFVVTLLVHASVALLCLPCRTTFVHDDYDAIDRDLLCAAPFPSGIFFGEEPSEPPYGTSSRVLRADVELRELCPTLGGYQRPTRPACVPFPLVHDVEEGETLVSIARLYGIEDWRAVYRDPANEWLFRQRPDPDRIFPGDRIVIPAPEDEIDCAERWLWF